MQKMTGPEHFPQSSPDAAKPLNASHETVRTLGAMVAILGATLGVNVREALAETPGAQPQQKANATHEKWIDVGKQSATFSKVVVDYPAGVGANQGKLNAVQGKHFPDGMLNTAVNAGGDVNGGGATDSGPASIKGSTAVVAILALTREGDPIIATGRDALVSASTRPDGTFDFRGLAPGRYDMTVGGLRGVSVDVGPDGVASGRLMRGQDGSVSIFDRWGNSVRIADNSSPIPQDRAGVNVAVGTINNNGTINDRAGVNVAAGDVNGDGRADSRTASSFRIEGHLGRGGDGKADSQKEVVVGGMAVARPAEFMVDFKTAGTPQDGSATRFNTDASRETDAGGTRMMNNSGTDVAAVSANFPTNHGSTPTNGTGGQGGGRLELTATNGMGGQGGGRLTAVQGPDGGSTPVNGIGGQGGGRYTFKPTVPGFVNIDSSNRDHIDQDAQTNVKKTTGVNASNGPGPSPTPQKLEPELLVVIAIIAMKGGGPAVSAPTGPDGTFGFKGLPPGDYELSVGGKVLNSLTVGADGLASGRVSQGPNGILVGLLLPAVQKLGKDSEQDKDKEKSAVSERFGSRGVSGFGSGAGPGGMTPPMPSPVRAGPSPMGPGPMGPGAMGGGAVRR